MSKLRWSMLFAALALPSVAVAQQVTTESELRTAVANAQAGTVITLADGTYRLAGQLATRAGGTSSQPIVVRALNPKRAVVISNGNESAFLLQHPNWTIRDLKIVASSNSTYGIKLAGNGQYASILNNEIQLESGSEAGVKGAGGATAPQPDYGLVEGNEIYFVSPTTYGLAEGLDAVAVRGWVIRKNVVHGIKTSANSVAYGLMTKGNSKDTVIEQNLVYDCFIGLSFGGGGTGSQWMRDADGTFENRNGVIRNNIVMNSTDVSLYLYSVTTAKVYNNTFYGSYTSCGTGCSSIDVRMPGDADIKNNILDKRIADRDGGTHTEASNAMPSSAGWFVNSGARDMHLVSGATPIDRGQTLAMVTNDFEGRARPAGGAYDQGACEYAAAAAPMDAGVTDSGSTAGDAGSTVDGGARRPSIVCDGGVHAGSTTSGGLSAEEAPAASSGGCTCMTPAHTAGGSAALIACALVFMLLRDHRARNRRGRSR